MVQRRKYLAFFPLDSITAVYIGLWSVYGYLVPGTVYHSNYLKKIAVLFILCCSEFSMGMGGFFPFFFFFKFFF